jgi:sulfate permease, SulP family
LDRFVPALGWLRNYDRSWLNSDLIAGATAAAVVVPQAMGYATVAGLPVEIGLYTCIFPMLVYALLGGGRRLSFSTTSTIVALTGLAITSVGVAGSADSAVSAAATLTLMVGVALIVFRLMRLGWMVEAVSEATITGLKVGVGLTIIADQLPKLLGIPAAEGGFFADLRNAVDQIPDANVATVLISGITLVALLFLKRWKPRIPGPLIALAVGISLVAFTGLTDRGVETIAEVPTGLPLPALPSLEHLEALLPFALAIALMSYFETVTAARIVRKPDDPPLDNNQEYMATGFASIVGSFFQTVPPAGGFSQTQVNTNAGAQTQLSELVTVVLAIAVALFLAPVLSDLPAATLGAIVVVSVLGLISLDDMRRLGSIDKQELALAIVNAFFALAFNLLVGVIVGVFLTLYFVLRALNHPVVLELRRPSGGGELEPAREGDQPIPGMLVLRIEGGLYTLNVRGVQTQILERAAVEPIPEVVLLDVGGTADTSVTVMDVMAETDHMLERMGSMLWIANIPTRALEKARRTQLWKPWYGSGRIHPTVAAAVSQFEESRRT